MQVPVSSAPGGVELDSAGSMSACSAFTDIKSALSSWVVSIRPILLEGYSLGLGFSGLSSEGYSPGLEFDYPSTHRVRASACGEEILLERGLER